MPTRTERHEVWSRVRRVGPIIGLTVTVTIGTVLGLWMLLIAVLPSSGSAQASDLHAHSGGSTASHQEVGGHPDGGVVAMPGLDQGAQTSPSPMAGHAPPAALPRGDMAAMSAEEMAAMPGMGPVTVAAVPSPTAPVSGDPMAGMSEQEMAAMAPGTDPHPAHTALGESGRPLAATMAGFAVVNLAVLFAAVLIGRRRARPGPRGPRHARTPARQPAAAASAAGPPTIEASTESAGSPS